VGFIWTVQLLVYPTMSLVPVPAFAAYEHYHQRRIVAVLAPFAVVEVVAAAWTTSQLCTANMIREQPARRPLLRRSRREPRAPDTESRSQRYHRPT
ncbi:MAG: hypothetical protein ACLGHQ_15225, partial [Acidimicrobiia bacterium]